MCLSTWLMWAGGKTEAPSLPSARLLLRMLHVLREHEKGGTGRNEQNLHTSRPVVEASVIDIHSQPMAGSV